MTVSLKKLKSVCLYSNKYWSLWNVKFHLVETLCTEAFTVIPRYNPYPFTVIPSCNPYPFTVIPVPTSTLWSLTSNLVLMMDTNGDLAGHLCLVFTPWLSFNAPVKTKCKNWAMHLLNPLYCPHHIWSTICHTTFNCKCLIRLHRTLFTFNLILFSKQGTIHSSTELTCITLSGFNAVIHSMLYTQRPDAGMGPRCCQWPVYQVSTRGPETHIPGLDAVLLYWICPELTILIITKVDGEFQTAVDV